MRGRHVAITIEWSFTGEQIEARRAFEVGLINEVVTDDELLSGAEAWVERLGSGPTLSYADHKTLLRAWSNGGVAAADQLMPAMAATTMLSDDAQGSLAGAIEAVRQGKPRPRYPFEGR